MVRFKLLSLVFIAAFAIALLVSTSISRAENDIFEFEYPPRNQVGQLVIMKVATANR